MCGTGHRLGIVRELRARKSPHGLQPLPFLVTRWRADDHGPSARLAVPSHNIESYSALATAKRSGERRRRRQGGLWQRSFGLTRASALQEPPLLLSTSPSPGSSPYGHPAATILRMSSRGQAFTGEVRSATRDAPGCVFAVTLRATTTLAALALQWTFGRNVRLHRHSQTAVLGERSYPGHLRSPSYAYCEMRGRRAIIDEVLVAAAGAELHDTLDTIAQGFQVLTDDTLRNFLA